MTADIFSFILSRYPEPGEMTLSLCCRFRDPPKYPDQGWRKYMLVLDRKINRVTITGWFLFLLHFHMVRCYRLSFHLFHTWERSIRQERNQSSKRFLHHKKY